MRKLSFKRLQRLSELEQLRTMDQKQRSTSKKGEEVLSAQLRSDQIRSAQENIKRDQVESDQITSGQRRDPIRSDWRRSDWVTGTVAYCLAGVYL